MNQTLTFADNEKTKQYEEQNIKDPIMRFYPCGRDDVLCGVECINEYGMSTKIGCKPNGNIVNTLEELIKINGTGVYVIFSCRG